MYHFAIHAALAAQTSSADFGWQQWHVLFLPGFVEGLAFPFNVDGLTSYEPMSDGFGGTMAQRGLGLLGALQTQAGAMASNHFEAWPFLDSMAHGLLRIGECLLVVAGALLLLASALLLIECGSALLPRRSLPVTTAEVAPKAVVLMPAHNEAAMITETVTGLQHQLRQDAYLTNTSLWVIADNCDDGTAELARQSGARVLERFNTTALGKGYALDHGLQHMADSPPDVVVMVDADCKVHPGAIASLIRAAIVHRRPIQGNYYMTLPEAALAGAGLKDRITVFAARVKNEVRSLGLTNLGLPCLFVGSGMACPWEALQNVSLASGDLVEDMKLGFDLAIAQNPPMFCRDAVITASLPEGDAAAQSQRTRWEHGRLDLTRRYFPKLIGAGLRQGIVGPIALALDMSILPLSLLVTLWSGVAMLSLAFAFVGGLMPLVISVAGGICLGGAILLAWLQVGRQVLPLGQLLLVPVFIFWKLPIFLRFLFKPQRNWIRTERDPV